MTLEAMRHFRLLAFCSLITTLGALVGVLIGIPFGRRASFVLATSVGTMAVLLAIRLAAQLQWLNVERRRGGSIGGLVGLALASPLASMSLNRPLVIVAAAALVGLGVLLGAGRGAAQ